MRRNTRPGSAAGQVKGHFGGGEFGENSSPRARPPNYDESSARRADRIIRRLSTYHRPWPQPVAGQKARGAQFLVAADSRVPTELSGSLLRLP